MSTIEFYYNETPNENELALLAIAEEEYLIALPYLTGMEEDGSYSVISLTLDEVKRLRDHLDAFVLLKEVRH